MEFTHTYSEKADRITFFRTYKVAQQKETKERLVDEVSISHG